MHICFVTHEYPPLDTGGIGTSIRNLGRALVQSRHRVTVLGWGREACFDEQGISVRFLKGPPIPKTGRAWMLLSLQREVNRLVSEESLDIVEAPDWGGMTAGMRPRCPLVIRCHGSGTFFGHLGHVPVPRLWRWAEKLALRSCDDVAAVSRYAGMLTTTLFQLRGEPRVVHNGLDLSAFTVPQEASRDPLTVLYLGSVIRKKGVLDLCQAFSRVLESVPDARLVMVGRDCGDKLTGSRSTWALCRDLFTPEARSRTEYLGAQSYDTIQDYYRRATVCAFPSYAEALPMTWLEAMASGLPVVAYATGWAHEIIDNGESGVLVSEGDIPALAENLAELLRSPRKRSLIAERARLRVEERFSVERVAAESLQWYRDVIEKEKRS